MIFYHYNSFLQKEALEESTHNILLKRFQYYLLIGGLPEAINNYLADRNMVRVRQTHRDIHNLYRIDASQYDEEHKLSLPEKVVFSGRLVIQVSHPSFSTTDLTDLLRALVGLRPLGIPKGDACHWKDARNLTDSSCANNLITLFPVDNHYVYI